jgi:hypothetical protein
MPARRPSGLKGQIHYILKLSSFRLSSTEAEVKLRPQLGLSLWIISPSEKVVKTLEGPLLTILQIELGTACGKLFRCSTIAVLDEGDSDLLSGEIA